MKDNNTKLKKRMYKCPADKCYFKNNNVNKLINHIEKEHKDEIPDRFTIKRWIFMKANRGKTSGNCVICKNETQWNENMMKYDRYCSDRCKKKAGENAKKNHMKIYGTDSLFKDPKYQEDLIKKRKISGIYKFTNGDELHYTGNYEKDFLEFCDKTLKFKAKIFESVVDNGAVFWYELNENDFKGIDYEKELIEKALGKHFYIPDFYIQPLNLLVEIKAGGDNPNTHHKIVNIDGMKDKKKYLEVLNDKKFNFIKISDKDYGLFIALVNQLKYKSLAEKQLGLYKIIAN